MKQGSRPGTAMSNVNKNIKCDSEIKKEELFKELNREDIHEEKTLVEGDSIVVIEYCTDCANHKMSTNHDENKYISKAENIRNSILKDFHSLKVVMKPQTHKVSQFLKIKKIRKRR